MQPSAGAVALLAGWPASGTGLELEALAGLDELAMATAVRTLAADWENRALALAEAIGHRYFALADGAEQVQQA